MEILGLGKVTKTDGAVTEREYIANLAEKELDMITGVAGKVHISGRYKPGARINISRIYSKVKHLNEKEAEIKAAAEETKTNANEIIESFPLMET